MLTLTYGFKKPQSQDKGPVVFPALEQNIQQLNDHTHNGTDSAPLAPASTLAVTQVLTPAGWVATAIPGLFSRVVTAPAGINLNNVQMSFRLSDGSVFLPTVRVLSSTQYELFINEPAETVSVVFK